MAAVGYGASLSPRWRPPRAAWDLMGGLPPGAMLTRSGAATVVGSDGRLIRAAVDAARFDHDPVSGARRGLLIEPATTNLAIGSEAFASTAWTNTGTAVIGDAGIAPDSTASADRIVETATTQQHRQSQAVTTQAGATYTFSLFVKAVERGRVLLRIVGAGTAASATLTMASRALSITAGSARVVDHADGWFRMLVTGIADGTSMTMNVNLIDDTGASNYVGNPATGLLVWGAQFEAGSGSSYVPTDGVAVARGADMLSLDWARLGVPDGGTTLRCTFDDDTVQDLPMTIAAGRGGVPGGLMRTRLKRVAIV